MKQNASDSALKWAEINFWGLPYTDKRRTKRVKKIATEMVKKTGCSIPKMFDNFYDVKAAYNLFKHKESTPENLQATHKRIVAKQMENDGEYLLIEDDSVMSWSGKQSINGLGPVGDFRRRNQGFLLHTVLGIKWHGVRDIENKKSNVEVLGIADQQHNILSSSNGKRRNKCGKFKTDAWIETTARLKLPPPTENRKFIRVCDREADIYEVIKETQDAGYDFIIRAAQNRCVDGCHEKYVLDELKKKKARGSFELFLRGRKGSKARLVPLNVSFQESVMKAPRRPGGRANSNTPIKCMTIHVWENTRKKVKKTLEWFLHTSKSVTCFEEALEVAMQYACRWIVEDFHKALKSGVGAEKLQLEDAKRLFAAVAIMSIVALRLIKIREILRINPDLPATHTGFNRLELKVLALSINHQITTVHDVSKALGKLGGHPGRKGDAPPGILTLWHGLLKLTYLVQGYVLASKLPVVQFG